MRRPAEGLDHLGGPRPDFPGHGLRRSPQRRDRLRGAGADLARRRLGRFAEGLDRLGGAGADLARGGLRRPAEARDGLGRPRVDLGPDALGSLPQRGQYGLHPPVEGALQRLGGGREGGGGRRGALGHQAGHALARLGEAALQRPAPRRQGLLDAPDRAFELFGQVGAAHADDLGGLDDEGRDLLAQDLRAGREGADDVVARGGERLPGLPGALVELRGDAPARLVDLLAQHRAAVGDMGADRAAGGREALRDGVARLGETLREVAAAREKPLLQRLRRALEGVADLGALAVQRLDHARSGLAEDAGDLAGIVRQGGGEQAARVGDGLGHVLGPGLQGGLERVAHLAQAGFQALARRREALHEVVALLRHALGHALAGLAQGRRDGVALAPEGRRDLVAAAAEGGGDALAGAGDGRHDALGGGVEFLGQGLVRALDRAAHPLGIGDDGFALRDQFLDQGADADLVVRIGPLQGRDLAAHQRFEFARAGEGPLDAVADRRHLAPDRLGHGQHGVGRESLGLGEPDRHVAHRTRDEAHLLGAHRQHGGDEEQQHGREHRGGAHRALQARQPGEEGADVAVRLAPGQRREAREPDGGGQEGEHVGRAGGLHPQALAHGADAAPVVVGHEGAVRRQQTALPARLALEFRHHAAVEDRLVGAARRAGEGIGILHVGKARLHAGRIRPVGRLVQVQRLLNRRQGRFRRILELLVRRHRTPRYAVNAGGRRREGRRHAIPGPSHPPRNPGWGGRLRRLPRGP